MLCEYVAPRSQRLNELKESMSFTARYLLSSDESTHQRSRFVERRALKIQSMHLIFAREDELIASSSDCTRCACLAAVIRSINSGMTNTIVNSAAEVDPERDSQKSKSPSEHHESLEDCGF